MGDQSELVASTLDGREYNGIDADDAWVEVGSTYAVFCCCCKACEASMLLSGMENGDAYACVKCESMLCCCAVGIVHDGKDIKGWNGVMDSDHVSDRCLLSEAPG